MLVTEHEAKTKRCHEGFGPPLADVSHPGAVSHMAVAGSAFAVATSPVHCIGSACMAWRWEVRRPPNATRAEDAEVYRGWCGKAGRPPLA